MSPREFSKAYQATAPRGTAGLWYAVFGPPAAWFISLLVGYFAVHEVCRVNSALAPRLVSIAALIAAIGSGLVALGIWRRAGDHERTRFLAQIGVWESGVFSLIMLLQIVATLIIPGCHERPRTPQSPDVLRIPTQAQSLT